MVKTTCDSARQYLDALGSLLPNLDAEAIDLVTDSVFRRWADDRQVLVLGNGGSASTAAHYVTDLVKTAWVPGQRRLRTLSMTDNPGLTTAIGNDIAFEESFSFPLESYAREGDLVIAISGSGNSPNIVSACRFARSLSLEVVGLTGFDGGELGRLADLHVNVPSDNYGLIEDLHLSMGHMIGQGLRARVERHVAGG
ncbi:MAG: D-sedoheptulose-7-phosphate isomerase [Phycisphaerales bacterium]|jgi:D-sedoheptulose 7-phosphate isomerase